MSGQRNKRMVSFLLSIAMVLTCFPGVPATAADTLATDTRDVTFKVKEGDLLIATNPVAWKLDEDRNIADDIEESIGKLDGTGTAAVTKDVSLAGTDPVRQDICEFGDTGYDYMKIARRSSERTEPVEAYKVGD